MGKGFSSKTQKISIQERRIYKSFLDKILQVIEKGLNQGHIVYLLLRKNLEKLNDNLVEVLRDWATSSLPRLAPSEAEKKAKALSVFSYFIREFNQGNKDSNLEIGIAGYQSALQVYTKTYNPYEWTNIHYNLGLFLQQRRIGNEADNLERAIKYFQTALLVLTRQSFPNEWSGAYHNLGVMYLKRIYGNKSDNIEKAIDYFNNALLVRTYNYSFEKWVAIQADMAGAYINRVEGEERHNLEKAIQLCQNALQFFSFDSCPDIWAIIHKYLGDAYLKNIYSDDRQGNIELSIAHFEKALEFCTPESSLEAWATVQESLGKIYIERKIVNRTENLEKAITHFEQALQIYTCDQFSEWALANLGIPSLTDDIFTLSTEFLCAGARSVISSLWAVDDLATALFSIFYYEQRQKGENRPQALRKAQIKLREIKKEDLVESSKLAESARKEARTKRSEFQAGSAKYLKWDMEYRKYAGLSNAIWNFKKSGEQFPFVHPRYWSAFICQGLR